MILTRVADDLQWMLRSSRTPRLRSMRGWAEQEVNIKDGPSPGRFRCSRQPYAGLLFDAIDSGLWNRFAVTGCVQSGKTLVGSVIPTLYHLFEVGEPVIFALPDMDMANDKWQIDILPVIERSKYREFLPRKGAGSKGGKVESVQFGNGATLKFMSGGGSDKSRSGYTSRVIVITETDGMDEAGGKSREGDKISQFEARTESFGDNKRIYMECTVSIEQGRTWQEYTNGTASRIVIPCPHCREYVSPERDDLHGWREAENETQSRAAEFHCPVCGESWDETHRRAANAGAKLLHKGQTIDKSGAVTGDLPPTSTLGFRWSAVNNLFKTSGELGHKEWSASRLEDNTNAEKTLLQYVWAKPYVPPETDVMSLEAGAIAGRIGPHARGQVPPQAEVVTIGVDVGKFLLHWVAVAWGEGATSWVLDYGEAEVPQLGSVEQGIVSALHQFHVEVVEPGFPRAKSIKHVDAVFVDSGYTPEAAYHVAKEHPGLWWPVKGEGVGQRASTYSQPKSTGDVVSAIGSEYHVVRQRPERVKLVHLNADYWKSWVHRRFITPMETAGAIMLYKANPREHLQYGRHLTAEKQTEEFIAGKGLVTRWVKVRKDNHYLDATSYACVAGHLVGVRLLGQSSAAPTQPQAGAWFKPKGRRR